MIPARDRNQQSGSCSADTEHIDSVCDFIRVDAAVRTQREQPVTLAHYLESIAGIADNPVLLDTAIRVVLDSASRSGRNRAAAAAELRRAHPELADAIGLARILDHAFDSTNAFQTFARGDFSPRLPLDFGPPWRGGEHRFSLTDRVAAGAYGVVFRGLDRALSVDGRSAWAAIKVLNANDAGAELARQEAIRARAIDHPAVARVLTAGETDEGQSFIAFEFVEGQPLRHWRGENVATLGPRRSVQLLSQIVGGVAAAHAVGVTHGDLHPGNILITMQGNPKIVDFGLGLFSPGSVIGGSVKGALGFTPPECWLGGAISPVSADVFGLGALFYWFLIGTPPNGATHDEAELALSSGGRSRADTETSMRAKGFDPDLSAVVSRALAPNPSERYPSAASFLADLERWLQHEPILWSKPTLRRRVRLAIERAPMTAAISLVAVLLAIGGAAASTAIALRGRIAIAEQTSRAAEMELLALRADKDKLRQAQEISRGLVNLVQQAPRDKPEERWLLLLSLLDDLIRIEGGTKALTETRLVRQIEAAAFYGDEAARLEGECSMSTLLWRAAHGRWLLEAGRWTDASAVLGPALQRARDFHPGDPMVERLSVMADAALVLGPSAAPGSEDASMQALDRLRHSDLLSLPDSIAAMVRARK